MPDARIKAILHDLASTNAQTAWTEFLRDYSALIFQVIRHFERNQDDAADCFQVVCEGLVANKFRRLRQFRVDGSARFSTWLRAVVRNLCLDWHRKKFGRTRVFRSVTRLSSFDQDVFRFIYQRGASNDECLSLLRSKFPQATSERIRESKERIESELTTRQRSLLMARMNFPQNGESGLDEASHLAALADDRPNPEAQVILQELTRGLAQALKSISAQDQLLIRLRFEEDLTLDQCARLMQLGNAQRADRRIKEILERLRQELS